MIYVLSRTIARLYPYNGSRALVNLGVKWLHSSVGVILAPNIISQVALAQSRKANIYNCHVEL